VALALRRSNAADPISTQAPFTSTWRSAATFELLAFLLFGRLIWSGFLSDDYVLLDRAAHGMYSLGNEFFRPLPMLLWGALWTAIGPVGPAFHAISIAAHGANAYLVSRIMLCLRCAPPAAFMAGVMFLAHPASVEAVGWISALFDVLALTGGLLFILAVLSGFGIVAGLGLSLAFLSKEASVAYPFIAVVLSGADHARLRRASIGAAVMLCAAALRVALIPVPAEYASLPTRYLLKELVSRTFGWLAAPWSAADAIAPWPLTWLATAAVMILIGVALLDRGALFARWAPRLAGAALISVLPVYRYFFVSAEMENARYLYTATAFWSMLLICLGVRRTPTATTKALMAVLWASVFTGLLAAHAARQSAWLAAAELRDRVLSSVSFEIRQRACETLTVRDLPDTVQGVFVFRNGFNEAISPLLDATSGRQCSGRWAGSNFVVDPER
jgi:hypothetical protein